MGHRPIRLIFALAALMAVAAGPGGAQERVKPKPVEGVPQPQTPSPIKPAGPAATVPAPAIASPAPWTSDLPQDQDTTARIGGLADEAMGGADCRTACSTSYYSCLAQDDSTTCSADWSRCLVACPPVSAGE